MNANELADELERFESFNGDVFFGTCAVMLRQQQAEIEALEKKVKYWIGIADRERVRADRNEQ